MSSQPERDGAAAGPLSDLRVLELGTLIAGPFAGRLLADFGA
jgi:formyl-CoA transferase